MRIFISTLKKLDPKAYNVALSNKWIQQIYQDLSIGWNKENCIKEAHKFKNSTDWAKNGNGSYHVAHKNNWLDDILKQVFKKGKEIRWTKELCMQSALKCSYRQEWKNNDRCAFAAAQRNGWFSECVAHMILFKNGFKTGKMKMYSDEEIQENALKYMSPGDWQKHDRNICAASHRRGKIFHQQMCNHMKL